MSLLRLQHRQAGGAILGILLTSLPALATVLPSQAEEPDTTIIFYAQPKVSENLWPVLFQVLRADLADGTDKLPNGFVLDKQAAFVRGSDDLRGIFSPGSFRSSYWAAAMCSRKQTILHKRPAWLGAAGFRRIQPFISIDCTRIAEVLRPAAAGLNKQGRQYMMDQAITHVLIHEWNHIATQSDRHSSRGISQAYLSVNDLIEEPKSNHLSAANR